MKQLAGMGDYTTYGRIITASSTYMDSGKVMCRSGDFAYCDRCKGSFPIYGTAELWIDDGKAMVLDNDLVLCRCSGNRVQAHSSSAYGDESDAKQVTPSSYSALAAPPAIELLFDERFQLVNEATQLPIANCAYAIKREDGEIEFGETDDKGRTHLLDSIARAENVVIYLEG